MAPSWHDAHLTKNCSISGMESGPKVTELSSPSPIQLLQSAGGHLHPMHGQGVQQLVAEETPLHASGGNLLEALQPPGVCRDGLERPLLARAQRGAGLHQEILQRGGEVGVALCGIAPDLRGERARARSRLHHGKPRRAPIRDQRRARNRQTSAPKAG